MSELFLVLLLVILLSLVFDFVNGFHDSANAIATSVSTRVLAPRTAVLLAATLNILGALTSTGVAQFIAYKIADPSAITQVTLIAALSAAILWDLITWYFGIPSSSSHAIMAALVGAVLASSGVGAIHWDEILKVLQAIVLSPLAGFLLAFTLMVLLLWAFHRVTPARVQGIFKSLQVLSASFMAFSHGSNDAQKTMGIMTMAIVSYYQLPASTPVPLWVILSAAVAMGVGTAVGGWRIVRTLGVRLTHLRPIHGFAAEATSGAVILANSYLHLPISTTHVISAAVMGVGASKRLSAVRWGVGFNIVLAWVLTLPACALLAWVIVRLAVAL